MRMWPWLNIIFAKKKSRNISRAMIGNTKFSKNLRTRSKATLGPSHVCLVFLDLNWINWDSHSLKLCFDRLVSSAPPPPPPPPLRVEKSCFELKKVVWGGRGSGTPDVDRFGPNRSPPSNLANWQWSVDPSDGNNHCQDGTFPIHVHNHEYYVLHSYCWWFQMIERKQGQNNEAKC